VLGCRGEFILSAVKKKKKSRFTKELVSKETFVLKNKNSKNELFFIA